MSLARSQFFFLKNSSVALASSKCGSKFFVGNLAKAARSAGQLPLSTVNGLANRSLNAAKKLPTTHRYFSTYRVLGDSTSASATSTSAGASASASASASSISVEAATKAFKAQNPTVRGRPVNSARSVGYWLIGSAGLVFGIVVLGGLTRLTESGLSITEWKPVTGSIPPLNQHDWEKEFELYRASPEFKILNSNMTLEEFKFIYFMEWTHRLWGRFIGLSFVLPAIYFIATKRTSIQTTRHLIGISLLIGLQGAIGWWMVKSGLNDKFLDDNSSHPRVSQYRLATHLGAAFLLYIAMINTGVGILRDARWVSNPVAAFKEFQVLKSPLVQRFRRIGVFLTIFTFCTAMSGAFVAGLDAGLIYNSFPMMGNSIVPPKSELMDPLYASKADSEWNLFWKNMLENPVTVQLNHRIMAVSTFCLVAATHFYALRHKRQIPKSLVKTSGIAWGLVILQASLGISTLIYVVPTPLAAAHQAGALALLTGVLFFAKATKLPKARIQWLIDVLVKQATKKKTN